MSKPTRPTRYILKNVLYTEEMGRVIVFADEMDPYVSALEAENAEAEARFLRCVSSRKDLADKLTETEAELKQAKELLRDISADDYSAMNPELWERVDAFLKENP